MAFISSARRALICLLMQYNFSKENEEKIKLLLTRASASIVKRIGIEKLINNNKARIKVYAREGN